MKLNLGCGNHKMEGFINIDRDSYCEPDVVADVEHLPFEDNLIDEIYACHILEHFDYNSGVLAEWHRVLKPGGLITVIVPDINKTYDAWHKGYVWGSLLVQRTVDLAYVNATVFGAHVLGPSWTAAGHTHKQIFIHDMLVQAMLPYFKDAHEVDIDPCTGNDVGNIETVVQGTK